MTRKRVQLELRGPWSFRQIGGDEVWMPASVPGCVHTDLAAAGKIEDPFYGTNEKDQQWIERAGWEYTSSFRADDLLLGHERVDLVCKGLDTYADVWIGESKVLSANNMFREWRADVRDFLRQGANSFTVRFRSPIDEVDPIYDTLGHVLPATNDQATRMVSMFTRKAPYHYGWDWGPRFVTSGIWRPMLLDGWERARIDDVQILQTELTDERARLRVRTTVASSTFQRARIDVAVAGLRASAEADVVAGANAIDVDIVIQQPRRWWPNGLGKPHLYDVSVALSLDDDAIDVRSLRIGLRTVEVEHVTDAAGKSFTIRVNGAPTFMKGANYIPSDSFVNRVTPERHRHLLQSAVDANMNMLRVWGGGIYEEDRFYELCDELGLLVWQDFMFACSMYPGDDAFVANVREEAIENVRRLRNHASVALWSGNNEIEVAWRRWGWQQKYAMSEALQARLWKDYQRLFHELLPAVVAEHDPARFYTRSSPSANDDTVVPDTLGFGDMHYWGVWHAEKPYEEYARQVSRFMSEYGFQSFPELDTVAAYAPATEWRIDSPVMLAHQRHPRGNALVGTYMERDFRAPKDFDSFLYVSQVLQAVVIEFAAHAHRRAMPRNAGSLYWQLDDCWPVASWSGIDYFGRWKALHYFARRFFAPVTANVVEEEGTVSVWIVCDPRRGFSARLRVRLVDFEGVEIWRDEREVRVEGNSSRLHASFPRDEILGASSPSRVVLVAEVLAEDAAPMRALHYFAKTKDLELPDPELALAVHLDERGAIAVRVSSRRLAKNVRLRAEPSNGRFEDNYFDLLPGETASVRWTGSSWPGVTAASIRDTYDGP